MISAIRLKIFQQMPNFRKPASFIFRESFPLPPYSTVIGMIHKLCGFKEYHDMKLSIQGTSASEISDLAVMYAFGGVEYAPGRHQLKYDNGNGRFEGITRGVKSYHLLTDLNMIIHIIPEEKDFEHIMNSLKNPQLYPSLGRHEDIARIDEVVEAKIDTYSADDEFYYLKHDAYIPISDIKNMPGKATIYTLPKKFAIDKKGFRYWDEVVKVAYLPYSETYESREYLYDIELQMPVAFA